MNTITTYRYSYDPSSKKGICCNCGKKRFVYTIDNETKEYLPDHVGRCDRENGCGYEYTWKQWLNESGLIHNYKPIKKIEPIQEIDFIPKEYLTRSIDQKYYNQNYLLLYLKEIFKDEIVNFLGSEYLIGTSSSRWKGATAFWQVDEENNVRQCKIIPYHFGLGKRVKDLGCDFPIKRLLNSANNLEQCFFGQHLLSKYPTKPVCIVESEKTAIIASVYMPEFVWLATGGAQGCKWTEYSVYKVLKGRSVTFFPDYGFINKKSGQTCFQGWTGKVDRIREVMPGAKYKVSEVLEKLFEGENRHDKDLADILINFDKTGLALTDYDYPLFWDFK